MKISVLIHSFFLLEALKTGASAFQVSQPAFTLGTDTRTSLFMAGRPGGGRGGGRRYAPQIQVDRPIMNEEITARQLRVVTPNPKGKDEPLGILSLEEALAKAKELGGLDLILVNDKSDPPVCKIVDYSKYRYMQEKKAKEVKKNSKASELKEVKMSYKIDSHDYEVRKKSAAKFIQQGNRVKCTVMFRGREMQHDNLGYELLDKLAGELDNISVKENRPQREGRNLSLMLGPRPEVLRAVNDARKAAKKKKAAKEGVEGNMDGEVDDDDDDEEEEVITKVEKKPASEKSLEDILGTDEYL